MALRILRPKPFRGSPVQATPLPQHPHRTEVQAFATYGRIGAVAELFRTLLLPLLTRLTQRHFRTQYFLTMSPRNRGHSESQLVAGETAEQLFRLVPRRLPVTVSPIGPGAERAHFLGRTIRLQLQWADPSQKRRLSLIIDANTCGVHRPRPTCGTTMIGSV